MTTILITGANRGIGEALTRHALGLGWRVIAGMRDPALSPFAGAKPESLRILPLDVADDASVIAAAKMVDEPIDILINNSGISGPTSSAVGTSDFAGFLSTLNINTVGPLRFARPSCAQVKRGKEKKIVTITSGMGELNEKFGLDALSRLQGRREQADAGTGDGPEARRHRSWRCSALLGAHPHGRGLGIDRPGGKRVRSFTNRSANLTSKTRGCTRITRADDPFAS